MSANVPATVQRAQHEDYLLISLNRPEVRNAINQQMVDELHHVCAELESTPQTLVLASAVPGVFASGADIAELIERRRDDALKGINSTLFDRIAHLPMPVIAAVDGYVLGGGAELAYAADFRIGTAEVKFGNPETSLGIMAAAGASWRLPELVGEPMAKEIMLTGRVLSGQEALAAGLLNSLHEPDALLAAAATLAGRIARQDPLAVQYSKRALAAPRAEHPRIDTLFQAELFESEQKFARMRRFLDRKRN